MENSKKNMFVYSKQNELILKILGYFYFAILTITFISFIVGAITLYGEDVNIISAIVMAINLFTIPETAIYLYLMKAVIGILYITYLVKGLKCFIKSFNIFLNIVNKKYKIFNNLITENNNARRFMQSMFKYFLVFILVSTMLLEYKVKSLAVVVIILNTLSLVVTEFLYSKFKNYSIECSVYRTTCCAIVYITVCILLIILSKPYLKTVIEGFTLLSRMQETVASKAFIDIYSFLVQPIIFLALGGITIFLIIELLDGFQFYLDSLTVENSSKALMITAIIVVAFDFVICIVSGQIISNIKIKETYNIIKTNLPVLLCGIVLFWASKFKNKTEIAVHKKNIENNIVNEGSTKTA